MDLPRTRDSRVPHKRHSGRSLRGDSFCRRFGGEGLASCSTKPKPEILGHFGMIPLNYYKHWFPVRENGEVVIIIPNYEVILQNLRGWCPTLRWCPTWCPILGSGGSGGSGDSGGSGGSGGSSSSNGSSNSSSNGSSSTRTRSSIRIRSSIRANINLSSTRTGYGSGVWIKGIWIMQYHRVWIKVWIRGYGSSVGPGHWSIPCILTRTHICIIKYTYVQTW